MTDKEKLDKATNDIFNALKAAGQLDVGLKVLRRANKKLLRGK